MAKTVAIGCRLPHGIILEHPSKPGVKVAVKGLNRAAILGAPHAVTEEVDADFWDAWKAANPEFPALKSGALFVAGSWMASLVMRFAQKVLTGFSGWVH